MRGFSLYIPKSLSLIVCCNFVYMQIEIIKAHHRYKLGLHDVSDERGNYLITIGAARAAKEKKESKPAADRSTKENKQANKRETK